MLADYRKSGGSSPVPDSYGPVIPPAERINGLDLGADDYLVKPFDLDELLARVRAAALRRTAGRFQALIECRGLTLNPEVGSLG